MKRFTFGVTKKISSTTASTSNVDAKSNSSYSAGVDSASLVAAPVADPIYCYPYFSGFTSVPEARENLPIHKYRNVILYSIEKYAFVCVVGGCNSGKSTQIPQYLVEAGYCIPSGDKHLKILSVLPTDSMAIAIASRVAEEMSVSLGDEVAFRTKYDTCQSDTSKIVFTSVDVFVGQMLCDAIYSDEYSAVIIEDLHWFSVDQRIILSLLKRVIEYLHCKTFKVIFTTASLSQTDLWQKYFSMSSMKIVHLDYSRYHPVDLLYYSNDGCTNYVTGASISALKSISSSSNEGDILVFLANDSEIELLKKTIVEDSEISSKFVICLLMSISSSIDQRNLIWKKNLKQRRIILTCHFSTFDYPICDEVLYVIDSGFKSKRLKCYDRNGIILSGDIVPISLEESNHRIAKAGVKRPGQAYLLYSELSHTQLPSNVESEAGTFLLLTPFFKEIFLSSRKSKSQSYYLDDLSTPSESQIQRELIVLQEMNALDDSLELTDTYEFLSSFPSFMDPEYRYLLYLSAVEYRDCMEKIVDFTAASLCLKSIDCVEEEEEFKRLLRLNSHSDGDVFLFLENHKSKGDFDLLSAKFDRIKALLNNCLDSLNCNNYEKGKTSDEIEKRTRSCIKKAFRKHVAKAIEGKQGIYRVGNYYENIVIDSGSCLKKREEPISTVVFDRLTNVGEVIAMTLVTVID